MMGSKRFEQVVPSNALMTSHGAQNGVEGPNPKVRVGGNSDSLVGRCVSFQDNVAAHVMDDPVSPVSASCLTSSSPLRSRGIFILPPGPRHERNAGG